MVATILILAAIVIYLAVFTFLEIRRRVKGKGSFFTEDHCDCKVMNGRRLVAYYRKRKKLEAKREAMHGKSGS
ncbi:MAG: hypothetical protein IJS37_05995 [Bacilli bacterium]|nr:hypothetical protein [Bacilli bacterium]